MKSLMLKITSTLFVTAVLFIIAALVIHLPDAKAQGPALNLQNSTGVIRKAFASEQITVDSTAGGVRLTAATINPTVADQPSAYSRASLAVCINQTAQIRYQLSGTAPTTTLGMPIEIGQTITIYGYDDINAFRAIRTTGTSGVIDCTYSRVP